MENKMQNCQKEKKPSVPGIRYALPFFAVLAILTVVSFIIPLRPTQSESEKRKLAEFPEFTMDALVSGDYFDEITTWFSDTFPGRETWLSVASDITRFHGDSEISIQGDLPVAEEVPEIPVRVEKPEYATEPAEEPEEETSAPPDEETEPAAGETEAGEEEWGGVDVNTDDVIKIGAVIQIGDSAFSSLGFSAIYSDQYAASLSKLAQKLAEKDVRVVSAPCPTAVGVMVEPEYLKMLNCVDQSATLEYMHSGMSDEVLTVDTMAALLPHNDEYIYFRTDHHWTALGAYYSYSAVCEALGYEAAPLDSFEEWDQGEFEGSLYGKVRQPHKLRLDNVIAYIPEGDISMMVYDNRSTHYEMPLLADTTERNINAKYLTFLSSDHALCEITNESLPDAPNCVVIKDSYGNCFAPFLTQNYHKVYAIDYRKFGWMNLTDFVEKYEIDDVIFIPYMTATQSQQGNGFFRKLCG